MYSFALSGGEAEAPEVLHGARLCGIRRRVADGSRVLVDEHHGDAAAPELDGEHEPAGAAAGNEHIGCRREHVWTRFSQPGGSSVGDAEPGVLSALRSAIGEAPRNDGSSIGGDS